MLGLRNDGQPDLWTGHTMKWYPLRHPPCACEADETQISPVIDHHYGQGHTGAIRDQQIRHYRYRDEARFWHWKSQAGRLRW